MRLIKIIGCLGPIAFFSNSCGGGKGSEALQQLLCGRGENKSKMTVGLDLNSVAGALKLNANQSVTDDSVKTFLNNALKKVNVSEDAFNVKSVESVIGNDSPVRFLQLGGTFGEGFGAAASYLKDAFKNTKGLDFVQESFGVKSAAAEDQYRKQKVREFAEEYMPFLIADDGKSFYKHQWAYEQTKFKETKDLFEKIRQALKEKNGKDPLETPVVVAVLDTGVDLEHPDLKNVLYKKDGQIVQYNATGKGSAQDSNGHGTHCAGIIASERNKEDSPRGVASMGGVKIMPIKVLGDNGSGGFQEIEKGVQFAVANGASVLSMSLGAGMDLKDVSKDNGKIVSKVFEGAIKKNAIVLVAAGNENCPLGGECEGGGLFSSSFDTYTVLPCAYDGTICVGATDPDETLAEYSNYWSQRSESYRTQADVNAPGTAIYSTWPTKSGSYKAISGTSMATPYVAGVAALIKTLDPTITQSEMAALLKESQAKPSAIMEKSNTGRVDLYTAIYLAGKRLKIADSILGDKPTPVETPVGDKAPQQDNSDGSSPIDVVSALWGAVCQ